MAYMVKSGEAHCRGQIEIDSTYEDKIISQMYLIIIRPINDAT